MSTVQSWQFHLLIQLHVSVPEHVVEDGQRTAQAPVTCLGNLDKVWGFWL